MSKFAKLFENADGDQLLLTLKNSEEHDGTADITETFETDGAIINLTIGGVKWKKAENYLEEYSEEKAFKILENPMSHVKKVWGI